MTDGDGKPPGKLDSFLSEDDLADIEDIFDAYVAERGEKAPQRSTPQAPRPIAPPDALDRTKRGPSRTVHGLQGFSVDEPGKSHSARVDDDRDSPTGTQVTGAGARPSAAQSVATGRFSVPTAPSARSVPASSTQSTGGGRRTLMAAAPATEDDEDDEPFRQRVPTGLNRSRSSSTISGTGIHRELDKALAEQSAVARKMADEDDWDADVSSFSRPSPTSTGKSGGSAVLRKPTRKTESPREITARTSANHPAARPAPAPTTRPSPAVAQREMRRSGPGSTLMFGQDDVDELVAAREASAAEETSAADTSPVGTDSAADTAPVGMASSSKDRSSRETSPSGHHVGATDPTPGDAVARAFASSLQAELDALGDDEDTAFDAALSLDGNVARGFAAPAGGSLHAEAELIIDDSDGDSASTDEELGQPAESTRVASFDQELGVLAPDGEGLEFLIAESVGRGEDKSPLENADFLSETDDHAGPEEGIEEVKTHVASTEVFGVNSPEVGAFSEPGPGSIDALEAGPALDIEDAGRRPEETARASAVKSAGSGQKQQRSVPRGVSPTLDIEDPVRARPSRQRDTAFLESRDIKDRSDRGGAVSPLGPLVIMLAQTAVVGGALYWLGFFVN